MAIYTFDGFELDADEARLLLRGDSVELQPKVFDALRLFVTRAGELIAKEELLRLLWPATFVTEESLTQVVRKLRQALGDDPVSPRYLETVPKRGYRWIAPTVRSERRTPHPGIAAARVDAAAATTEPGGTRATRARWLAGAALLAVAVGGVVAVRDFGTRPAAQNPLLAGGEPRRITSSLTREGTPAISRDGRFAAVSVNSGAGGALELELVPLDGGRPIALTATTEDEWQPRFSPDGRELLFLRGLPGGDGAALWTMGVFGGSERRLAPLATTADWSPDGRQVAFARPADGGWAIELLELSTGATRGLATLAEPVSSLAFSPSGRQLAFLDGNAIATIDLAGGRPARIRPPARHVRSVVWENDELLLTDAAWSEGASRISRLGVSSAESQPLLVGPPGIHELALAANGRLLYVAEHKSRQVWRLDAEGGAPTALDLPTTVEGFDVDAAARNLAFTDWDPAPGFGALGLLDLARGGRRDLGDGLCPALSGDGARVAALGDRPGATGLSLVEVATGERTLVAPDRRPPGRTDGALFRCPDFSPDGRAVAYTAIGDQGEEGLWIVEPGSRPARLVAEGSFGAPSWSPDGTRIALCDYGQTPATVRVVSAMGGETHDTGLVCPFRAGPVWDSERALWLLENQKLDPTLALWSLDGLRERAVPLRIPRDLGFWGVFDVRRAGDGSWFALAERYESDLYLLEAPAK